MKTNSIKERIKEYFFLNPTIRLRVRQIERTLSLPLPSVIRYAKELEKERILKETIISEVKLYSADRSSKEYLLEKKCFNLKSLHRCGLVDFLAKELHNPAIILFGSYAKGEDTEVSDIDIYIEASFEKKGAVEEFEKALKRKIQFFTYKNVHHIRNKELANNILNGIIINGHIEIFI
ncbi:MAG TPA: nucleotidyltransferase domain-containing protein [Candidatus Nanoarchaeia archaeon]|nr:nucleotidyltransferase domain-containing protein [Candidatus Nanoarchaeia archaeon]